MNILKYHFAWSADPDAKIYVLEDFASQRLAATLRYINGNWVIDVMTKKHYGIAYNMCEEMIVNLTAAKLDGV